MTQPDLDLFTLTPSDPLLRRPTASQQPMADEMTRRQGNALKVLQRLQLGPATGDELDAIGGRRFGGRILELRQDGWDIVRTQISPKLHRYELRGIRKP